jgi:hypothetical protein
VPTRAETSVNANRMRRALASLSSRSVEARPAECIVYNRFRCVRVAPSTGLNLKAEQTAIVGCETRPTDAKRGAGFSRARHINHDHASFERSSP